MARHPNTGQITNTGVITSVGSSHSTGYVLTANGNNSTSWVYSGGGGGGGSGGSGGIIGAGTVTICNTELMITVKDNKTLKVGETLEKIMAHIGMIQPDMALIERFPALKSAHEEYQSQFAAALAAQNPDLKAAIDSYKMIAALVKDEPEDNSDG